ncbi:tRNA (adenosine(37)-N6)-threonylcarbamoyltransferase complex dimerization subunit type 1 TsaB [Treponema pectinovorum]|uniref:tRNA (adenosine(37)-N6)-threonylcarbamoyltransferase complex dimerization subunit type 1 TsaB n=1 Tax=Treponema pectinovorum TaxID=164 RepID=UPI003D8DDE52
MKSLAIDCASNCMTICAKNDDNTATLTLDIGQKQSQEILPAIDFVLKKLELNACDLDYLTLCKGPGTFTGLRLAFSALKSIELAFNKPIYAVSTLECYAKPFENFDGLVISCVGAKKDQFFAEIFENGKSIMEGQDIDLKNLYSNLNTKKQILCVGFDSSVLCSLLKAMDSNLDVIYFDCQINTCLTLFKIAEKMIEEKKEPLKDFEGPEYLRKSEAELSLEKQ